MALRKMAQRKARGEAQESTGPKRSMWSVKANAVERLSKTITKTDALALTRRLLVAFVWKVSTEGWE